MAPPWCVRVMRAEDVPAALEVWKETGLQEGTHCLYTWLKVDPEAFKIAVTETGEIIGVCAAVRHYEDFYFVGIYAVKEKFRGLGVGIKIWQSCMARIGESNAALNAVPDKITLYRDRGGFPVEEPDWQCVVNEINDSRLDSSVLSNVAPDGVDIMPFKTDHLQAIYRYDLSLAGYSRKIALESNFQEPDSRTFVALDEGKCVGFGTIKMSCHKAGQVGPLYADSPEIAEVLLRRLMDSLPQATGFAMMTISSNEPANEMVKRLQCPVSEDCPRLYRKERIKVDTSRVFAHFDLNFSPF